MNPLLRVLDPLRDITPEPQSLDAHRESEVEFRSVAMTKEQAELIEEHGLDLMRQGDHEQAIKFLALNLAWRFGRAA